MPLPVGSTKPNTALAAIAASTALPPCCSTSRATCVAIGCDVAAIPFCANTAERLANCSPVTRSTANEFVTRTKHATINAVAERAKSDELELIRKRKKFMGIPTA